MPNIDISRDATDYRKHYDRVQMQQGRVLTDDDFNEAARLDAEDARRVRVDVIGPAGSPDDGFRLKIVTGQLVLSAGTFYVGGLRLEMESDEPFNLQKDWLQQGSRPGETLETLTPPAAERYDFVWLDVWQQPVSAVEDKELFEAALGGADTSARIRTMRRARVLRNVGNVDCASAWTKLLTSLNTEGSVNGDFELVPNAILTVGPDGTAGTADLCSPPVSGGYLGAENQAIRVQIVDANKFTWGFDNGAPLYRVKLLDDGTGAWRHIHMLTVPKDQAHYPLEGQVVELLPWSALLPNGQKNAELSGFLAKVSGSYNPDTQDLSITTAPGDDTGMPLMPFGQRWSARSDSAAISNEAPPEDQYFYMRVWNRGGDTTSPAAINFVPGTPVSLAKTGIQITFAGTNLRTNDFWIIAARPETPNEFVPWQLSNGRSPFGVRRWIAPLGIVHWPGGGGALEVEDNCRPPFLPLTQLRGCECCAVTLSPDENWQSILRQLLDETRDPSKPIIDASVCFQIGEYVTNEPIRLAGRGNLKITGGGPGTKIRALRSETAFEFAGYQSVSISDLYAETGKTGNRRNGMKNLGGVLAFRDCMSVDIQGVTLRGAGGIRKAASCIMIENQVVSPDATDQTPTPLRTSVRVRHSNLEVGRYQIGILVVNAARIQIEDNRISANQAATVIPFARLMENRGLRADYRRLLVLRAPASKSVIRRFPPSPPRPTLSDGQDFAMKSVTVTKGTESVTFLTPAPFVQVWPRLLNASRLTRRVTSLQDQVRKVADRLLADPRFLTDPAIVSILGSSMQFLKNLKKIAQAALVGSQGIVVGGFFDTDVRIRDNTISGVAEGIHVGLSHRDARRGDAQEADSAGNVSIDGNTVDVEFPIAIRHRGGIFVGNCGNLVIERNQVSASQTRAHKMGIDGICVFGFLGRMSLVRENRLKSLPGGIYVHPLNPNAKEGTVLWLVRHNVVEEGVIRSGGPGGPRVVISYNISP